MKIKRKRGERERKQEEKKKERENAGIVSLDPFWSHGPLPKEIFWYRRTRERERESESGKN